METIGTASSLAEFEPIAAFDAVWLKAKTRTGVTFKLNFAQPQPAQSARSNSACCKTVWVALSCLSGGYFVRLMASAIARVVIPPKWPEFDGNSRSIPCESRHPTTRSTARDTLSREPSWWRKKFHLATLCRENWRDHGFCTSYLVEELAPTLRNNPSSTNRLKRHCAFRESNPICSAYSFRVIEVLVARNARSSMPPRPPARAGKCSDSNRLHQTGTSAPAIHTWSQRHQESSSPIHVLPTTSFH